MTQTLNTRPSIILNLKDDEYASFCLDEAVSILITMLNSGEKLRAVERKENLITYLKDFDCEVK